jgi:hypothetical protein
MPTLRLTNEDYLLHNHINLLAQHQVHLCSQRNQLEEYGLRQDRVTPHYIILMQQELHGL